MLQIKLTSALDTLIRETAGLYQRTASICLHYLLQYALGSQDEWLILYDDEEKIGNASKFAYRHPKLCLFSLDEYQEMLFSYKY